METLNVLPEGAVMVRLPLVGVKYTPLIVSISAALVPVSTLPNEILDGTAVIAGGGGAITMV